MINLENCSTIYNSQRNESALNSFAILISGLNDATSVSGYVSSKSGPIDAIGELFTIDKYKSAWQLISDQLCVVGSEILSITYDSHDEVANTTTFISKKREMLGSKISTLENSASATLRTVIDLTDLTYEYKYKAAQDLSSEIFSFGYESGYIELEVDDINQWSVLENGHPSRYQFIQKKTVVYIFEGLNGQIVREYTGFCDSIKQRDDSSIYISFRDKFFLWQGEKINKVYTIRDKTPKEFLSSFLDIPETSVRYINGSTDANYGKIDNLSTKEYKEKTDVLSDFVKTGIRFRFNHMEDLVVHTEQKNAPLNPINSNLYDYINENDDIFSLETNSENWNIVNKFNTTYVKRDTLFDRNDFFMSSKDVTYTGPGSSYETQSFWTNPIFNKICEYNVYSNGSIVSTNDTNGGTWGAINYDYHTAIKSFKLLNSKNYTNDAQTVNYTSYEFNSLKLAIDKEDYDGQIKSEYVDYLEVGVTYVMIKSTLFNHEFMGLVSEINLEDGYVLIALGYDKDFLYSFSDERIDSSHNQSKIDYYKTFGYHGSPSSFVFFFGRKQLPQVWRYSKKINNEEVSANMNIPILPKVVGAPEELSDEFENHIKKSYSNFGSVDTEKGDYAGYVDELDYIYDTEYTTDGTNGFFYQRELEQSLALDEDNKRPLFFPLIVKRTSYPSVGGDYSKETLSFDKYGTGTETSIKFEQSDDSEYDFTVIIENKDEAAYGSLIRRTPLDVVPGGIVMEVVNQAYFKIGDCFKLKKVDENSPKYSTYQIASDSVWAVVGKEEKDGKHYLILNKPFPSYKPEQFEFWHFDCSNVSYLNELYMLGNPFIQQETTINELNQLSIDIHGEREHSIDGKMMKKEDIEYLIDYLMKNYATTDETNTKATIPLELSDRYEIETLDVVEISAPTTRGLTGKFLITSKEVTNTTSGRSEMLKGVNLNDYVANKYKINDSSLIVYQSTELPTYNHRGEDGSVKTTDNKDSKNLEDQKSTAVYKNIPKGSLAASVKSRKIDIKTGTVKEFYIDRFYGEDTTLLKNKLVQEGKTIVLTIGGNQFKATVVKVQGTDARLQISDSFGVAPNELPQDMALTFAESTTFDYSNGSIQSDAIVIGDYGNNGDGDGYIRVNIVDGIEIKSNNIFISSDEDNYIRINKADRSLIYFNAGQQQIGNGVIPYPGASPYDGFFFGAIENVGLPTEVNKSISFDGTNFVIGDQVRLNGTDNAVDVIIKDFVNSTYDVMTQGITTYVGNLIAVFDDAGQDIICKFGDVNSIEQTTDKIRIGRKAVKHDGQFYDGAWFGDSDQYVKIISDLNGVASVKIAGTIEIEQEKQNVGIFNYLKDSGNFTVEKGTVGWVEYGNCSMSINDSVAYGDYDVLRLNTSWAGGAKNLNTMRLKPGTVYTASAYVKKVSPTDVQNGEHTLTIAHWTTENASIRNVTYIDGDTSLGSSWKKIYRTFTTDVSTDLTYAQLWIYPIGTSLSAPTTIDVAYAKVEEGEIATDWYPNEAEKTFGADMGNALDNNSGNIINIPDRITDVATNGLNLTSTYMGFYNSSTTTWGVFIKDNGRFQLKADNNNYIIWDDEFKIKTKDSDVTIENDNNVLFFDKDGANSYLKLNLDSDSALYSIQLGSSIIDSSITPYEGFFFGDPNLNNNNYVKYDYSSQLQGLEFAGSIFNKTAYCRTAEEFLGAVDVSNQYVGFEKSGTVTAFAGGTLLQGTGTLFTTQLTVGDLIQIGNDIHEITSVDNDINATVTPQLNINYTGVVISSAVPNKFYGKTQISEIVLENEIQLYKFRKNLFDIAVPYNLKVSSNISSINGAGNIINMQECIFNVEDSEYIDIFNIEFYHLGGYNYQLGRYIAINANNVDASFSDIKLSYILNGEILGTLSSNRYMRNIEVSLYSSGLTSTIFNNCSNIDGIKYKSSFRGATPEVIFFKNCRYINNAKIEYKNGYDDDIAFYECKYITNPHIYSTSYYVDPIDRFLYPFYKCENISNFKIFTGSDGNSFYESSGINGGEIIGYDDDSYHILTNVKDIYNVKYYMMSVDPISPDIKNNLIIVGYLFNSYGNSWDIGGYAEVLYPSGATDEDYIEYDITNLIIYPTDSLEDYTLYLPERAKWLASPPIVLRLKYTGVHPSLNVHILLPDEITQIYNVIFPANTAYDHVITLHYNNAGSKWFITEN